MNDNSVLIKLIDELKLRLEIADGLERRIEMLEKKVHAFENNSFSLGCNQNEEKDIKSPYTTEKLPSDVSVIIGEEETGNVLYFDSLSRDEDGSYYVEVDQLQPVPGNYKLVINGEQAKGYVTTDREKIKEMMKDFKKYLFPLRRPPVDPMSDSGVETVDPGLFALKGNKWYMNKKISINYV